MSVKLSIGKVAILEIHATHNEAIISKFNNANQENVIRDYLNDIIATYLYFR